MLSIDELSVGWEHGHILTKGNWNQSVQDRQLFCFLFFLFLFFVLLFSGKWEEGMPSRKFLEGKRSWAKVSVHIETKRHFELGGTLVNTS